MNVLSIVMPCHNRAYDLINVLNAYDNQTATASFELIAVDDGSIDATHQLLSSFQPTHYTLRVARLEKNRGPAAARNIGIELATAPLIMFVGDDIVPEPELIQGHLQAHCQYPEPHIAILGRIAWANDLPQNTLMIHIDGIGAQQFSYYYFHDNTEYDFRHFYTSNVSLKTDFLKTLDHWFDTDFPYPAFEDAELAYRLSERGLRIIYRATLLARHYHYHTIWSFSIRQYHCGLMAWLITRKHAIGLGRVWYHQYLHLITLLLQPGALLHLPNTADIERMENQILHMASSYEWVVHPLLDNLYIQALNYFYCKGIIDGLFGKSCLAKVLRGILAQKILFPFKDNVTGLNGLSTDFAKYF